MCIEEQEKLWAIGLKEEVSKLCDAHEIPLDPAIERIFVPTPEEILDVWRLPPERIINFDAIVFVHKLAQRDETGALIPPERIFPHGDVPAKSLAVAGEEIGDSTDLQRFSSLRVPYGEEIENREQVSAHGLLPGAPAEAKRKEEHYFFTCCRRIWEWVGKTLGLIWKKMRVC